jgi:hypothetical protein
MKARLLRLILVPFIVCATTDVVLAGVFPGAFSFANPTMSWIFLWPFRIAGCG